MKLQSYTLTLEYSPLVTIGYNYEEIHVGLKSESGMKNQEDFLGFFLLTDSEVKLLIMLYKRFSYIEVSFYGLVSS